VKPLISSVVQGAVSGIELAWCLLCVG